MSISNIQCCEKVFAPFQIPFVLAFLSQLHVSDHQTHFSWTVHHLSMFSTFVDNGCHCGSLESQRLRNSFVTLFTLMDVSDFVSHLILTFFGPVHDVLLFEIF